MRQTTLPSAAERPVGSMLRQWRTLRRISQLDLAIQTDISTRHLSFVETGRARPSSQMILRLSEELTVPLRERNRLLLAGGFAPIYTDHALDDPEMAGVRAAIREVLAAHRPFPAIAVDRCWNVVEANESAGLLTGLAAPHLLTEPLNALRLCLHPDGLAPHTLNLGEWRHHLLSGLRRAAQTRADADLTALYDKLAAYPCDDPAPPAAPPRGAVHVPLRLRADGRELSFLAIIATIGTAVDITVSELAIESFFPADAATADYLRQAG